jgi:hypothetical protein
VSTTFDGVFHPDGMHVVFCGNTIIIIIIIIPRGSICPKTQYVARQSRGCQKGEFFYGV